MKKIKNKIHATTLLNTIIFVCVLSVVSYSGSYSISGLPYTISSHTPGEIDTVTLDGTKLTSTGTGITIATDSIYLDFQGDSLFWNSGGATGAKGILIFGNNSDFFQDITITNGYMSNYEAGNQNYGICLRKCKNININNMTIVTKVGTTSSDDDGGYCIQGWGLYAFGTSNSDSVSLYNIDIRDCKLYNESWRYYSRHMNLACAIQFVTLWKPDSSDYRYSVRVRDCYMESPHVGMELSAKQTYGEQHYPVIEIDACSIYVDARNTYDSRETANCYAIGLNAIGAGSTINNCYIRSGTEYSGGRGIYLSGAAGTEESPIIISNNDVDVHNGPSNDDPLGMVHGLRLRYSVDHTKVYNNKFICRGDNNSGTSAYGEAIVPMRFTSTEEYRLSNNTVFEGNLFKAVADGDGCEAMAAAFECDDSPENLTNISKYNRYESNVDIIRSGEYNGGGDMAILMGDTLVWSEPRYNSENNNRAIFRIEGVLNKAIDVVYDDDITEDDVIWASSPVDLAIQTNLEVIVLSSENGLPIEDAHVTVTNNYGREVMNEYTNTYGIADEPVTLSWFARNRTDSTSYNNFTINISKDDQTTSVVQSLPDRSDAVTLYLSLDGEPPDTSSPGDIENLNAIPGEYDGEIELTWTAPGNDGSSGVADHYEIRYSDSEINSNNWNYATLADNPPSPASPGTTENFTISGLNEGETYYIAIKTFDDTDLESNLSNIAESYAGGISVPVPMTTQVNSSEGTATFTAQTVDSYYSLYYLFELDSLENYPEPSLNLDLTAEDMAVVTFGSLSSDVVYYWRVRAVASSGADTSDWSYSTQFNIITGIAQALASSDCAFPLQGQSVESSTPTLKVNNLAEIETYYFQVDQDEDFTAPIESGAIAKSSGLTTDWEVAEPLEAGQTYYWRVSSNSQVWTAPIAFTAQLNIHPYPNPFRPARGHTSITFDNLIEESNIVIATLSGDIIRNEESIGPVSWIWDVKDNDGDDLAPGVYLYKISSESGKAEGKVVVIR